MEKCSAHDIPPAGSRGSQETQLYLLLPYASQQDMP
jgi:hypothetical protein